MNSKVYHYVLQIHLFIFLDGSNRRLKMSNGKSYNEQSNSNKDHNSPPTTNEIDKVVIHKKRRRLSESSNERKPTPPENFEAKVTISKRISSESISGEAHSANNSSGSNSPKNHSINKRKKRKYYLVNCSPGFQGMTQTPYRYTLFRNKMFQQNASKFSML